jgi:3-hydroxyisobutyrate dehydrogenase-like beta-hydroxyacid dehydrogenase
MQTRIGFAGLGLMGGRMARHFVEKGFPLAVWNRTPGRAEALAAQGARVASSPRELALGSDVVVACVADPAALERVVFAEDGVLAGARPGFRFVDTSTVSPETSRRVAEAFRAIGADALEAPMTGSKLGAERGTLLFMTGGRRQTHDELLPVLMAMGSKAIHCGDTGQASVVKLVGNSMISFMLEGLCEGILVARRAGVPPGTLLEVIMASGYASPYYTFKGDAIQKRDFATHFSIDLLVKDQTLMLAEAAKHRVPMPGLAAIREVYQSARGQGLGAEDIVAVIKALERAAGE